MGSMNFERRDGGACGEPHFITTFGILPEDGEHVGPVLLSVAVLLAEAEHQKGGFVHVGFGMDWEAT
jgi:hypothetical protein